MATPDTATRPRAVRCLVAGVLALVLTAAAACRPSPGPAASVSTPTSTSRYRAHVVLLPLTKPTGRFTDTTGRTFDIAKATAGHPTLVYFGYTHCPDVCPLTMANLGAAVKQLPEREQRDLRVVFVTTDPHRDGRKRLRTWLNAFDRDFIGLAASWPTIARAANHLHVGVKKPTVTKGGDYRVTHGAEVFGWSRNGGRTYMFAPETPVQDYRHDLPLLVRGVPP